MPSKSNGSTLLKPSAAKTKPPPMFQVVTGDPGEIADELLTHPAVELITFTGGAAIGKAIAARAGYRRMVLELGGNDPLIVMDDADLD